MGNYTWEYDSIALLIVLISLVAITILLMIMHCIVNCWPCPFSNQKEQKVAFELLPV
jgi:Tfp pilus assembly protein PilX